MSLKKSVLASIIVSLIFGVLLGVLLLVIANNVAATDLIKWAMIITGIIIVISNIPSLVAGIVNVTNKEGIVDLIFSVLGIILGCMMIFMHNAVISILVAIYLIIFPIIRVILAPEKGNQLKKEWLKILIGVLVWVFLPGLMGAANDIVKLLVTIAAWVIIGLTVVSFVISLVTFISSARKAKKIIENSSNDYIETDAD